LRTQAACALKRLGVALLSTPVSWTMDQIAGWTIPSLAT
jgi:hypothetical protein